MWRAATAFIRLTLQRNSASERESTSWWRSEGTAEKKTVSEPGAGENECPLPVSEDDEPQNGKFEDRANLLLTKRALFAIISGRLDEGC